MGTDYDKGPTSKAIKISETVKFPDTLWLMFPLRTIIVENTLKFPGDL